MTIRRDPNALEVQADLRANGLLADADERWNHPSAYLALESLPLSKKRRRRLTLRGDETD